MNAVKTSRKRGLPVCIYRKPFENTIKAVFQNTSERIENIDFDKPGFIFSPFNEKEGSVIISAEKIVEASYVIGGNHWKPNTAEPKENGKEEHLDLIRKGKQAIASGSIQKVILSRKIETEYSVTPETILVRLLDNYPSAFCYLFFHPDIGIWCGATPETFLEISDSTLKTMSLAGTIPYQDNNEPEWSQKELDEQEIVTDFLKSKLSPHLMKLQVKGPDTVKAGKLWHLKTDIEGEFSKNTSLNEIIGILHPTPAVCGFPVEAARDFINKNEGYDRKYYTGFLGELKMDSAKKTSLYVNLRCMELTDDLAHIYVGGGITFDSIPENEWEEVQNKSRTMMSML